MRPVNVNGKRIVCLQVFRDDRVPFFNRNAINRIEPTAGFEEHESRFITCQCIDNLALHRGR